MSAKKIIFLVALILIVFVTILRERGIIDLSLYKSNREGNTLSSWQNSSNSLSEASFPSNNEGKEQLTDKCNFNGLAKNIPIEVIYQSKKYGDKSNCKHIVIEITGINSSMLWTPIYKSSSFQVSATIKDKFILAQLANNKLVRTQHNFNGNITISGNLKIFGFCSYLKAKTLIVNNALEEIYKNARENIK